MVWFLNFSDSVLSLEIRGLVTVTALTLGHRASKKKRQLFFFFLGKFFHRNIKVLYKVVLVSAIQQHESAIVIRTSPPC